MRRLLLTIFAATMAVHAQNLEVSGLAGYGMQDGDDQARTNSSLFGASFGWRSEGRHGFTADYAYADFPDRIYGRHWLTGSWVFQARRNKVRPFLQAGAGAVITRLNFGPFENTQTDFALLLGVGSTIDIGESFFVRPQIRSYLYVGPTVGLFPAVAVGWRF